jgi:HPt (histidine-containing phosphotransfer) domain-containing protein
MPACQLPPDGLDLAHLDRQTAGDLALARELLALFEGQCLRLLPLISGDAEPQARAEAAHTLRGAASAVGAARVADITGRIEAGPPPDELLALTAALAHAVAGVRAAIRLRLASG